MDWQEFQHAGLMRLAMLLREHARDLADVDAWLSRCGRPPSDHVRAELRIVADRLKLIILDVRAAAKEHEPYRPGVDPWKSQGIGATLRPDFAARGITKRHDHE